MTMKKILYLGNKLSYHGYNKTYIEILGVLLENQGYQVISKSNKKNQIFRLLHMMFAILSNFVKTDYVIIDTYSTKGFYFAFINSQLCRLFRLKYIPILHGGDLTNRLKRSPFLCNLIFKNAYKNVAPSGYMMDAFKQKYPQNLIHIPNVIKIEKYNFLPRKIEIPKLLWVRSFSRIYNPKMAINVLFELIKQYPQAQLCMVGPDKENFMDSCKAYAKSLDLDVQFTGKLSKEDWIELSKNYNVFINTTHFDNTPISVIEAMALGLPVVSTNVGGIPFLLKDKKNALLVNDNDVIEMVNAIKELLTNKTAKNNIVCNARQDVELFDWNKVKQKWFDILK